MEKPEYISLKDLCNEIEAASFTVKMRGYAPEEVDTFMDGITERLKAVEEKLDELRRYETWLRVELQAQVVEKAQQEARQILQAAQDRSRAMLDSTSGELARKQEELNISLRQYADSCQQKRSALEQELGQLQQSVAVYRRQAVQALETALSALREESPAGSPAPRRAAEPMGQGEGSHAASYPTVTPAPTYPTAPGSSTDIDRMLEEIRRQVMD